MLGDKVRLLIRLLLIQPGHVDSGTGLSLIEDRKASGQSRPKVSESSRIV